MEDKEASKKILKVLKKEGKQRHGLSITDIVRETNIPRCQVRIVLAFLLGSGKIEEQIYGMAKIYYEEENEKQV